MLRTIAVFMIVSGLAAAPSWADDAKLVRTLQINGHGEVHQAPDLAIVTTGVVTSAVDAKSALAANTKSMTALFAVLKSVDIADKDVQTSNFSVQPQYDYSKNNGQPPKVVGYQVSNNVTVTVRKVDALGDVLDKLVSSGSNQVSGISFSIADPQAALDAARKAAMADALRKANVLSSAAGVKLGAVASISEGGESMPQPVVMMRAKAMSPDAAPVPIAQGEQLIGADVNVVWSIE